MLQSKTTTQKNSSKSKALPVKRVKNPRMKDQTFIMDGEVMLYRTTHSGDVWQMRVWISGEKKYIRESVRTRDLDAAKKEAKKRYLHYNHMVESGQKIFSLSTVELRDRYLEYIDELVASGQMSKGRQTNIKAFTKRFVEFAHRDKKISNIDKKEFQKYRAFRQSQLKTITMTVVRNEAITIKQMYRWAANEGLIPQTYVPDFGAIKVPKGETVRKGYTNKGYKQLTDFASKWYASVPKSYVNRDAEIYYRKSIRDFILLMANFGFRTGELMLVKFQDVRHKPNGLAYVEIHPENTKVRKGRLTGGQRGDVFIRKQEYSKFNQPDDFVFTCYNEKRALTKELLYDYYKKLINEIKLKHKDDFDDSCTLYDLRHYFITLHLQIGKMNVYDLANICGTSLKQIQDHYDHVIQSHKIDEMFSISQNVRMDDDYNFVSLDDAGRER